MATSRSGQGARGQGGEKDAGDVDALFQLPLTEFTAARNALVSRLKKAGRAEEAEQVKGLQKPPVSAWVVNQLYWRHRAAFDRLIDTGEKFRKAQAAQLAGKSADVRGPLDARRQSLSELSKLADRTLTEAGHNPTPDTMRRVTTTLEALSTFGALPDAPPAGRLQDDVDPPGFETLAALVPRVGGGRESAAGPTRVLPFRQETRPAKPAKRKPGTAEEERKREAEERRERIAAAKAAVQEAERTLRDVRKAAEAAEAALKKVAARAKEADKEKEAAERRLEQATAEADAARKQARKTAADAEDAAQAVDEAERALAQARSALSNLDS